MKSNIRIRIFNIRTNSEIDRIFEQSKQTQTRQPRYAPPERKILRKFPEKHLGQTTEEKNRQNNVCK